MMNEIHQKFRERGLVRPVQGRVFAGVCAGLGQRFGIDPWPARLLFVLVLLILPGSQFLIYPVLWILMPTASHATSRAASHATSTTETAPPPYGSP